MCLCVLFMDLKILKFCSSGLILMNLQPRCPLKMLLVVTWCSGYRYWTTSFNKGSAQVQILIATCRRFAMVRTVVPAGNKVERLSSVNHSSKTIHHHLHVYIGVIKLVDFYCKLNLMGNTEFAYFLLQINSSFLVILFAVWY